MSDTATSLTKGTAKGTHRLKHLMKSKGFWYTITAVVLVALGIVCIAFGVKMLVEKRIMGILPLVLGLVFTIHVIGIRLEIFMNRKNN